MLFAGRGRSRLICFVPFSQQKFLGNAAVYHIPRQDLILTDGTTLLGGDDKAAIAAVMTMAEHYLTHPEIGHGPISLAFTPDGEVGGLGKLLRVLTLVEVCLLSAMEVCP